MRRQNGENRQRGDSMVVNGLKNRIFKKKCSEAGFYRIKKKVCSLFHEAVWHRAGNDITDIRRTM